MSYQVLLYCQKRLSAEHWVKQLYCSQWRTNLIQFDSTLLPLMKSHRSELLILEENDSIQCNLKFLEMIRQQSHIPILVISQSTQAEDRSSYYESGADDVVHTTVDKRELHARVMSILRRQKRSQTAEDFNVLECGDIKIDPATWSASCRGEALNLTSKEFNILALLMQTPGKLVKKQTLSQKALLNTHNQTGRGLDAHICNIRKKISHVTSSEKLKTVRGEGYIILNQPSLQ